MLFVTNLDARLPEYADAYAFLGNSLLVPMTEETAVGLAPEFWEQFPDFGSQDVARAAAECAEFARSMEGLGEEGAVERVAVEFARLFVGPPHPAAAPWETMHRGRPTKVGFGQPTFEMREWMRRAGLQVSNRNNQYEDHMGLELLLLSELCRAQDERALEFMQEHPLAWIERFCAKVAQAAPQGYFHRLLCLTHALLAHHASGMRA